MRVPTIPFAWHRLVPFLALLAGCAGAEGGGPTGTGIAASVAGNIVAVVDDTGARDESALAAPGVRISIDEVPGVESTTDEEGNFVLEGDFSGEVTVRFRASSVEAMQSLEVPTGGLVVLSDVVVSPGRVDAEAGRQVGFLARVDSIDCAGAALVVSDEGRPERSFLVQIVEDTRLERRGGDAAVCADIASGDRVAIDGIFEPGAGSGTEIIALAIVLGAERGERPDVIEDVPFLGFVTAIDCAAGRLTVSDARQRTRLRITADTTFTRRGGSPLGCDEVGVGSRVAGVGRLRIRQPGRIEATRVVVANGSGPVDVRLFGVLVGSDCSQGVLQIDDGDGIVAVRIGPQTVLQPALTCEAIPIGARVDGLGRLRREAPQVIVAVQLRVRRPQA